MLSLTVFLLFTLLGQGSAVSVNYTITIDDKSVDFRPIILQQNAICGYTNGCYGHGAGVNSDLSNRYILNIPFVGSAIYIYFTWDLNNLGRQSQSAIDIYLDEEFVDQYSESLMDDQNSDDSWLVYSTSSLTQMDHTLAILTQRYSISMFDYAIYTVADQPSSTATPNPDIASATTLPLVIGGTIGGLIIISLILLVLFCRRRGCDSHRLLNMQVAYHGDNIDHMSSRERRRLRREAPCAYHSTSESDIVSPIFARLSSMDQEQRCPIHGCTTPSTSRLPETATRTPRDTDTELHPELHPVESVHREEMEEADLMRGVTEIHYPFTR